MLNDRLSFTEEGAEDMNHNEVLAKLRLALPGGVKNVLECSFITYTLRFSALASCVALPPASMQSCARCFFALTKKILFSEVSY